MRGTAGPRGRAGRLARRGRGARRATGAALAAAGLAAAALTAAPAQSAACATAWGSLPETQEAVLAPRLVNLRAGRHACFDRFVVDLDGRVDGYRVRYVPRVGGGGEGEMPTLRGGARLHVMVTANAVDADHRPTYDPPDRAEAVNVTGYRTFRQVYWGGEFEGECTVGLGVRARLPFRVFVLDGPGTGGRVVVDVAHTW